MSPESPLGVSSASSRRRSEPALPLLGMRVLDLSRILAGPLTAQALGDLADPQVHSRGLVIEAEHPQAGAVKYCANPIRFDGVVPRAPMSAPLLGQHTQDFLRETLGYNDIQILELRAAGVIGPAG
jgi:crotonobetainyl-CoA:carnitine CoA-transferase CaiB-like acyl-CoA transferase